MQLHRSGHSASRLLTVFMVVAFCLSIASSPGGLVGITNIETLGLIGYPASVYVTVDFNQIIAVNNLSLGVNIGDNFDFAKLRNDITLQGKVGACQFRLIRLFMHEIQPCTQWNESLHEGTYSWALFDRTIERVFELEAEPLLVLASGNLETKYWLPRGMNGNYLNSKFPSNESFGAFCAAVVKHCNVERNWRIRFWEVWNEPEFLMSNATTNELCSDPGRISNFTRLFNFAARSMHEVDPTVLCGHGFSAIKAFFDHFVDSSDELGFFSIHDYDAHATMFYRSSYYKTESEIMADASVIGYQKPGVWRTCSPQELRALWRTQKGCELPVLITEANVNSAGTNGTDPRMQTVFGAAWYAEKLRAAVLENVAYSAYFTLASDHSAFWNSTELTGGFGFGLLNSTPPYVEWFPYFANLLLGSHLSRNDEICDSVTSDFSAVSSLAWTTQTHHCILLVGKTADKASVSVNVTKGSTSAQTEWQVLRIDGNYCGIVSQNYSWTNPLSVEIDGFSVVLISTPV